MNPKAEELERLRAEAGELTAIFSQSQLTAKTKAGTWQRRDNRRPILNKSVNS